MRGRNHCPASVTSAVWETQKRPTCELIPPHQRGVAPCRSRNTPRPYDNAAMRRRLQHQVHLPYAQAERRQRPDSVASHRKIHRSHRVGIALWRHLSSRPRLRTHQGEAPSNQQFCFQAPRLEAWKAVPIRGLIGIMGRFDQCRECAANQVEFPRSARGQTNPRTRRPANNYHHTYQRVRPSFAEGRTATAWPRASGSSAPTIWAQA